MKYLVINDIHFSDRAPSSATETYLDDLFDMLASVRDICSTKKIDAVVLAGDVFHYKSPHRNSHRLVHRVIDMFQSYPCTVYVVPGNHDLQSDRLETLYDTQPLGVVIRSGALVELNGWAQEHPHLYGVPWLQEWNNADDSVREQAVELALQEFNNSSLDSNSLIVTHAPFFPPGKESPWENYPTPDFAQAIQTRGCKVTVAYGHVHEYHGIYQTNGVTFVNPGALSRGSLHEYNLNREISVSIWDSESGDVNIVTIPHKPAEEVFKLQQVQEQKDVQVELDQFLSSVNSTTIEITSTESVVNYVKEMPDIDPEVIQIIENLLMEENQ